MSITTSSNSGQNKRAPSRSTSPIDKKIRTDESSGAQDTTNEHDNDATVQDGGDSNPNPDLNATTTTTQSKKSQTDHKVISQITLRNPQYTYFHLRLYALPTTTSTSSNTTRAQPTPDILTFRQNLSSAFTQFLGLTGSAIQVDILKYTTATDGEGKEDGEGSGSTEAWIRVPMLDGDAVQEALAGWTGGRDGMRWKWVVKGRSDWLVKLGAGDGQDLFN